MGCCFSLWMGEVRRKVGCYSIAMKYCLVLTYLSQIHPSCPDRVEGMEVSIR